MIHKLDQALEALPLHCEQLPMALHRPAAVKGRAFQNPPDLIEWECKLPKKENLL